MLDKTFYIHTLGCKTNQSESENIRNNLIINGFNFVNLERKPAFIIVNTCTVTSAADKKARQIIKRTKRISPDSIIIATGCAVILNSKILKEIGADYVFNNKDKEKIINFILNYRSNKFSESKTSSYYNHNYHHYYNYYNFYNSDNYYADNNHKNIHKLFLDNLFFNRSRPLIKIQDGCENKCSYCIVPMVRGRYKSESVENIIKQIKFYESYGFEEIVLTGIHIGKYGVDFKEKENIKITLPILLENIIENTKIKRIRLSSIEVNEIEHCLINLIKNNPNRIAKHLHIPLQSGSDKVLLTMNRSYSSSYFKDKLNKIYLTIPDIAFTTDVIVGFPGETEQDFLETLSIVKELQFSKVHIFKYSARPYTSAKDMNNQIDEDIKNKRSFILKQLCEQIRLNYLKSNLDKMHDVVCESYNSKTNFAEGTAENYIKVYFNLKTERDFCKIRGKIIKVLAVKLYRDGLFGISV